MSDHGELATLYACSVKEVSTLKAHLQEANLKIDNLTSELRETRELLGEVVMANYRAFPFGGRLLSSDPTAAAADASSLTSLAARPPEPPSERGSGSQAHLSHPKRPRSISLEYVDEPQRPNKALRQQEEERMSVDPTPTPVHPNAVEVKAEHQEESVPGPDIPQADGVQMGSAEGFEEGEVPQPNAHFSSTDAVQLTRAVPPEVKPQSAGSPAETRNASSTVLGSHQVERRAGEILGNHTLADPADARRHTRPQDDPRLQNETQPGASEVGSLLLRTQGRSAGYTGTNPTTDPRLRSDSFSVPTAGTSGNQALVPNANGSTSSVLTTSAGAASDFGRAHNRPEPALPMRPPTQAAPGAPPLPTQTPTNVNPTDPNHALRTKRITIGMNDVLLVSIPSFTLPSPTNYVPMTFSLPPCRLEVPLKFLRSVVDRLHTTQVYPPGHRPRVLLLGVNMLPLGVPSQPGHVGVIPTIREDVYSDAQPWSLFCQRVPSQDLWMYMGEYTATKVGDLDAETFKLLPKNSWDHLAKPILSPSPPDVYVRMRARIALRMHGRLPSDPVHQDYAVTDEAHEVRSRHGLPISEEQILQAFQRGEEKVAVVALLCVAYRHSLMTEVTEKWNEFSHSQAPAAEVGVSKPHRVRSKRQQ